MKILNKILAIAGISTFISVSTFSYAEATTQFESQTSNSVEQTQGILTSQEIEELLAEFAEADVPVSQQ